MSARNFDNLPPHATNTVTISTTPQVRIAPGGQIRSIGVPVRPQPVPIRKVHHDGSAATTSTAASTSTPTATFSSIHVKDEPPDALDYQTTTNAATSSGPLLPPASTPSTSANANSFQQYQRGSGQGTSSNNGNSGNLSMDQPAPVNLASKVAEVFLTAGHAFQKLGDLTLQLHTTTDTDESKWTDKEVDNLRDALTRFAHELDQISTCVASRTTKHIKNDIKRRHMIEENNQQVKRMAISGTSASGASYSAISTLGPGGASSMHTVPLAQKRVAIPSTKVVATRAVVPTRYTVGPSSSSSALNNGGMPQLQQQSHTTRLISNSLSSSTRIGPAMPKFTPASMTKRIMTAGPSTSSSSSSNQQKSGALVMDSND